MANTCRDASPCRWAGAFKEDAASCEEQLVDLLPSEQISRGRELLRLLREPITPRAGALPSPHAPTCSPASSTVLNKDMTPRPIGPDTKVLVKNTFIERAPSSQKKMSRTRSDSALLNADEDLLWHELPQQRVVNLSDLLDRRCQKNSGISLGESSHGDQLDHKRPTHRILNLSACLEHNLHSQKEDALADLSDASTGTPRDAIDEISVYDVFDSSLIADLWPNDTSSFAKPQQNPWGRQALSPTPMDVSIWATI